MSLESAALKLKLLEDILSNLNNLARSHTACIIIIIILYHTPVFQHNAACSQGPIFPLHGYMPSSQLPQLDVLQQAIRE